MLPVFASDRFDLILLQISSLIWVVPEVISSFTPNGATGAKTRDRASAVVLLGATWAGIYVGVGTAFAAPQLAIAWDRPLLFAIGISLMLAGVAFRWYSIRVLGKFFTRTVSIQVGHSVVEKGPYRYIRHPSYTGAMLTFIGFALTLTNWLSLGVVLLGMILGYGYRVHVEEQALIEGLGPVYKEYMLRTKRFIPYVF
jgi:protein-S-isoprenylcysteine O-methyltransferase Ste14